MKAACAPRLRSSASSALPSGSRRPDATTVAPSLAKANAVARPMPVRAPVMRITGAPIVIVLLNLVVDLKRADNLPELHAGLGSVGAVAAVDVEDVTGDEPAFVRAEEYDAVGDLLGEDESTERNLGHQRRLVLRRAGEARQHAGVRGAGPDGIYPNPRFGEFERHRLGDAFDGVLGADIDRGIGRAPVPIGRGDIDDAAAALGLHGAHFVLHAQHHAENVGLERRGKTFRGLVRDRADRTFGGGVVHRDIEAAKARDGFVDHGADIILLADVGVDELGFGTERAQLGDERLAGLITPAGNDHVGALPGEGDGGGATDAGQGAGDQYDWVTHV